MGEIDSAKWVSSENIHLTLKFLGPAPEDKVDEIANAIEEAISGFRKFFFSLGGIGGFPNVRKARVLWVGVQYGKHELIALSKAIEEAMTELGFKPENKELKPHITLARIKTPLSIEKEIATVSLDELNGRVVNVDGITLFQSHLKRSGAEYESLRYIPLPGTIEL